MINIIGIGVGGNTGLSKERIQDICGCHILIGAKRFLEQFNDVHAEKVFITSDLQRLLEVIKNNAEKKIVILASGDPNLYGISDFILKNFPADNVSIYSHVSSMQIAFAAAKVTMNEAVIVSVHGRDVENIVDVINRNNKVGIFTTNGDTPHQIAEVLKKTAVGDFDIYICEDMGFESERITKTDMGSIAELEISPLNVMILLKKGDIKEPYTSLMGLPDHNFYHKNGMITKSEIRVLDISKLRLHTDSILWDIGAGCGSVSIESASIAYKGTVFSIEHDNEQFELLSKNVKKFGMENIKTINEGAPDVLKNLPSPDRIFIGGSGGRLRDILTVCREMISKHGIIVINAVTLNTLIEGCAVLKDIGFNLEVFTINISRARELNGTHLFKSTNPIYIISGKSEA